MRDGPHSVTSTRSTIRVRNGIWQAVGLQPLWAISGDKSNVAHRRTDLTQSRPLELEGCQTESVRPFACDPSSAQALTASQKCTAGASLTKTNLLPPTPYDQPRALGTGLKKGPRRGRVVMSEVPLHRGISLTRKRTPIGPYRRLMPRVLGGS